MRERERAHLASGRGARRDGLIASTTRRNTHPTTSTTQPQLQPKQRSPRLRCRARCCGASASAPSSTPRSSCWARAWCPPPPAPPRPEASSTLKLALPSTLHLFPCCSPRTLRLDPRAIAIAIPPPPPPGAVRDAAAGARPLGDPAGRAVARPHVCGGVVRCCFCSLEPPPPPSSLASSSLVLSLPPLHRRS